MPARSLYAQSSISLTGNMPLNNDLFTFESLWDLSITMPAPTNFLNFYLTLEVITDNNQVVYAESNTFPLTQGVLVINPFNMIMLQPIKTNYTSSNFYEQVMQNGGYFPTGTYTLNYTLYGIAKDPYTGTVIEKMATTTVSKTASATYNIILLEPIDGDTLRDNQNVFFSWTPVFGINLNNTTPDYAITIVRVDSGQSREQAIEQKPPFFEMYNINETVYNYPPSGTQFTTRQQYAWQVKAFNGSTILATSNIHVFDYDTLRNFLPLIINNQSLIFPKPYAELRTSLNAGFVVVCDTLKFKYIEPYYLSEADYLHFKIYDNKRAFVGIPTQESSQYSNINNLISPIIKKGTNFVRLPLTSLSLLQNKYYILEIQNQKGDIRYLRFYYTTCTN